MRLAEPTSAISTIIGTLLGLSGVVVGGLLTVWHQRRLERDKAINARADALARELASAIQQLAISVASAAHSMCWLTWLASTRPERLTQARIDKYDEEQHVALPKILGYLTTTAALDVELYQTLRAKVDDVFRLDAAIGRAGLEFDQHADVSATALGALYDEAVGLERQLPIALGNLIGARIRSPSAGRDHASG